MLAKCNEKLKGSGHKNLEFIYADAENLEFPVNSIDRIYCSSAFFWMSHPLAALRHWLELLTPDGGLGFNAWPEDSFLWGDGASQVLKNYGINYILNRVTGTLQKCRKLLELAGYENIQIHEVKSGRYISLEEAKGHFIDESAYAPGQYPHPVKNVPEDIMKQAHADFEAEVEKLATEEGVWHDMTMYYVYGQKM